MDAIKKIKRYCRVKKTKAKNLLYVPQKLIHKIYDLFNDHWDHILWHYVQERSRRWGPKLSNFIFASLYLEPGYFFSLPVNRYYPLMCGFFLHGEDGKELLQVWFLSRQEANRFSKDLMFRAGLAFAQTGTEIVYLRGKDGRRDYIDLWDQRLLVPNQAALSPLLTEMLESKAYAYTSYYIYL